MADLDAFDVGDGVERTRGAFERNAEIASTRLRALGLGDAETQNHNGDEKAKGQG
jgi:hypothetical protein